MTFVDPRTLDLHHVGQQNLVRYQRLVDEKDLDGLSELVTDDVLLVRAGTEQVGREHFLDLYRRFAASDVDIAQHMASNIEVREIDPGADDVRIEVASAFVAFMTHTTGEARMIWGRYRDDVVLREGRWLLAAKRIALVRTHVMDPESMIAPVGDSFGSRATQSSSSS